MGGSALQGPVVVLLMVGSSWALLLDGWVSLGWHAVHHMLLRGMLMLVVLLDWNHVRLEILLLLVLLTDLNHVGIHLQLLSDRAVLSLQVQHTLVLAATGTPAQRFVDAFGDLVLDLLGLASEQRLSFLGSLALNLLLGLGIFEVTFQLCDACLRRLVLLLEEDHLLLMTAHHLVHRFAVLVGDFGELPVELRAEELLQLLLLLGHRLLVLFQICLPLFFQGLDLRLPFLDLQVHVVGDLVEVKDPLLEPGRPCLALSQLCVKLRALALCLAPLLPLCLGIAALLVLQLVKLSLKLVTLLGALDQLCSLRILDRV